ncbi:MAG: Fic family protein [Candidatus Micrarchaeota archaeon]|nr:Fic family protein [Candidatus Micrarchaeota archaeon]
MRYLSVDDIKRINQKVLDKYEKYPSKFQFTGNEKELDRIATEAKTYKDPASIAAIYLYNLNRKHIFNSANKRTAFLATDMFFQKNKILFEITDEEAVKLSKDIRNDKYNLDELKNYLASRINRQPV